MIIHCTLEKNLQKGQKYSFRADAVFFPKTKYARLENKDRFCNTIATVASIDTSFQSD